MSDDLMDLVSRAHLLWKRRIARDLVPYRINPKQIFVLRRLAESGPLAPSQIAEMVFADRPTVTSMLATMQRVGWLTRRRDAANRKRVNVEITAAGRKKLASVPLQLWRTGRTTFDPEAGLSTGERSKLIRLLQKLNAWIERAGSRRR